MWQKHLLMQNITVPAWQNPSFFGHIHVSWKKIICSPTYSFLNSLSCIYIYAHPFLLHNLQKLHTPDKTRLFIPEFRIMRWQTVCSCLNSRGVPAQIFFSSGIEFFFFEAEIWARTNFFPAHLNFFRAGTPLEFIHETLEMVIILYGIQWCNLNSSSSIFFEFKIVQTTHNAMFNRVCRYIFYGLGLKVNAYIPR